MAYSSACPSCGHQLQPVVLGPDSAPWLCPVCRLGFWVAELHQPKAWDAAHRCFGHAGLVARREAVHAERSEAHKRGCSVRSDQLGLLSVSQLGHVAKVSGHKGFVAEVEAVLKQKGGR